MGYDETRDILTLAELEQADDVGAEVDPDPLGFRWCLPVG